VADFSGMVMTDVGRNLQAQVQTGEELLFTRIALGDGVLPFGGDLETYTALVSEMKSVPLSAGAATVLGDETVRVRGILNNTGMTTGFFVREVGLFAQDPDDPGTEILYSIAYASSPDYLPAEGATAVEQIIDVIVSIGNATNVTVQVAGDMYLTDADITAHDEDGSAHADIRAEIDADITTHDADAGAHAGLVGDISDEIDADITAHDEDGSAHADIRAEIDTDIATHDADAGAHAGLVGDISDEIDADITAHDEDGSAHADIRAEIDTDIATHDADADAHADIRNRAAVHRVEAITEDTSLLIGDQVFVDTSSGTITVTLPASANSSIGDAVELIDIGGSLNIHPMILTCADLNIVGMDADLICDVNYAAIRLVRSSIGWILS
jgi:hypothetical protein